MGDYQYIIYEKEGQVGTITMNLADRLNVMDFPWQGGIFDDLLAAIDEAELDDDLKVIVFKGAGESFCAGHDLTTSYNIYESFDDNPEDRRPSQHARLKIDRYWYELGNKILISPKITVAQVQGFCFGEGTFIAEACDFSIVAENAKISHLEQRMGFAGSGIPTLPLLYHKVGYTRARDLLLTGRTISGLEAVQVGWATKAVPEDKLDEEVKELCRLLTVYPRDGIGIGKATNHMVLNAMGITRGWGIGYFSHAMGTNMRFEKGEFNFLSNRRKQGVGKSIHQRDKVYEGKQTGGYKPTG